MTDTMEVETTNTETSTTNTMQIMDSSGHMTVTWNPSNQSEVDNAEEIFDQYIEKGYQAFQVQGNDQQGARMKEFDRSAAKVMMVPQLRGG